MRRILIFGMVCLWATAASAAKPKIAVFGVESVDGGDARSRARTVALAKALTAALRERVANVDLGYEIAPNSSKDLVELKLLSDCVDEGTACMSAIGRDAGADVIVYGHVDKQKDGYVVTVTSLAVANAQKAPPFQGKRQYAFGAASEDEMRKLAAEVMVNPAAAETSLVVEVNAPTGTLYVNGTARGAIVNGRISVKGVPTGVATVAVDSPGYERFEQNVDVRPGAPTKLSVELVKGVSPHPGLPAAATTAAVERERPGGTARVLFWTSLVATGAGVAAFTITGLKVKSIEDEQDAAI